jgi:hypothetical protein
MGGRRVLSIVARRCYLSTTPSDQPPIIVVQNWFEELKRLVPKEE